MLKLIIKIFLSFLKIGAFTFGGGYAMIPFIEREIIELNGWLNPNEFLDILAISQMTPGPIAVNASTFVGYKILSSEYGILAGFWGSLAGTIGVIIVSVILSSIVARYFFKFKDNKILNALFRGIRPAVIVLIAAAVFSVGKSALVDIKSIAICAALFIALLRFKLSPILGIVLSGIAGAMLF